MTRAPDVFVLPAAAVAQWYIEARKSSWA